MEQRSADARPLVASASYTVSLVCANNSRRRWTMATFGGETGPLRARAAACGQRFAGVLPTFSMTLTQNVTLRRTLASS
jgi:hypothetical protein